MPRQKKDRSSIGDVDHSRIALKGMRQMLYYKDLVPGQKVSCRDVAEKLGMSLTPVIQALKFMEFQGLARHEPNRGYFMTPLSLEELEEIYELRGLIEPSLLPDSIKNLDGTRKNRLKVALEDHRSAGRGMYDQERYFRNVEFHLALASLSDKSTQIRFLRNLFDLLLLKYGGNTGSDEGMNMVDEEHQRLYEMVISGDVQGTRKTLLKHIVNVKEQVLDRFRTVLERREMPEF